MPTIQDVQTWRGQDLYDNDHNKIGEITDIYLDRQTGAPEWLAVKTGMFGSNVNFVPIRSAKEMEDHVMVPFEKSRVKDAPNAEADGELTPEEERRLYDHYGVEFGDFDYEKEYEYETRGMRTGTERERRTAKDEDAMTRSEEELHVGTRPTGESRARLRKYVVTEHVDTTVPVQREEVRVEREPITEANVDDAMSGPDIKEDEHEVTLRTEEPVVEKRTVPKERVRLEKDTVTEEKRVSDDLRKEKIEADTDAERRRR